jgi:hypothetical protein
MSAGRHGQSEVVRGVEEVLDVGTHPHLLGGAHQDPDSPRADVGEEPRLPGVGVRVVDEGDLRGRNASGEQLVAGVVVDAEPLVGRDRPGEVAEDELRQALRCRLLPDRVDVLDQQVDLAAGEVGGGGVHHPHVERDLPPVVRDGQHVVLAGVHAAAADPLRPADEGSDGGLLFRRGLGGDHLDAAQ